MVPTVRKAAGSPYAQAMRRPGGGMKCRSRRWAVAQAAQPVWRRLALEKARYHQHQQQGQGKGKLDGTL
jgi:hypothetical protein